MNTKVALGILVVTVVAITAGIFITQTKPPPTSTPSTVFPLNTTASTAPRTSLPKQPAQKPAKSPAQPSFKFGTTTAVRSFARFDATSLVSTSAYPVITGTANVSKVGLTIYTSEGVGIVRPGEVIVTNGRWSYSISVALAPGTYTLVLIGGGADVTAKLVVKSP